MEDGATGKYQEVVQWYNWKKKKRRRREKDARGKKTTARYDEGNNDPERTWSPQINERVRQRWSLTQGRRLLVQNDQGWSERCITVSSITDGAKGYWVYWKSVQKISPSYEVFVFKIYFIDVLSEEHEQLRG